MALCGGDEMFFHPGFAARNAVTAVELAELGARASETALDGPVRTVRRFGPQRPGLGSYSVSGR